MFGNSHISSICIRVCLKKATGVDLGVLGFRVLRFRIWVLGF